MPHRNALVDKDILADTQVHGSIVPDVVNRVTDRGTISLGYEYIDQDSTGASANHCRHKKDYGIASERLIVRRCMSTGILSVLVFPAHLMAFNDAGGLSQHGMHTAGILAIDQLIIACIDHRIQVGIQQHILSFT